MFSESFTALALIDWRDTYNMLPWTVEIFKHSFHIAVQLALCQSFKKEDTFSYILLCLIHHRSIGVSPFAIVTKAGWLVRQNSQPAWFIQQTPCCQEDLPSVLLFGGNCDLGLPLNLFLMVVSNLLWQSVYTPKCGYVALSCNLYFLWRLFVWPIPHLNSLLC